MIKSNISREEQTMNKESEEPEEPEEPEELPEEPEELPEEESIVAGKYIYNYFIEQIEQF